MAYRETPVRSHVIDSLQKCVKLLCAVGAIAACTDPTAVGEKPEFLGVSRAMNALPVFVSGPDTLHCPGILKQELAGMRRIGINGSGATLAFPAAAAVQSAGFGREPGTTFSVPGVGLIAIVFDDGFPRYQSIDARSGRGEEFFPFEYLNWCGVTVGGQPATLHFTRYLSTVPLEVSLPPFYAHDMALLITEPSGRRMNIRLLGRFRTSSGPLADSDVYRLLALVASLRW